MHCPRMGSHHHAPKAVARLNGRCQQCDTPHRPRIPRPPLHNARAQLPHARREIEVGGSSQVRRPSPSYRRVRACLLRTTGFPDSGDGLFPPGCICGVLVWETGLGPSRAGGCPGSRLDIVSDVAGLMLSPLAPRRRRKNGRGSFPQATTSRK